MNGKTTKTYKTPWSDDSPEKLLHPKKPTIGFKQQLKGLVNPSTYLDQIFGNKNHPEANTPFANREKTPSQKNETLVFSRRQNEEEKLVHRETQEILIQLKKQIVLLEKSEKALSSEITKIKVEQLPQKTGIYYLRYFEWLTLIVRQMRVKVEEGRAWLSTFTNRKKKRSGYWQMFKKHGTTFGLSQERTLAHQIG